MTNEVHNNPQTHTVHADDTIAAPAAPSSSQTIPVLPTSIYEQHGFSNEMNENAPHAFYGNGDGPAVNEPNGGGLDDFGQMEGLNVGQIVHQRAPAMAMYDDQEIVEEDAARHDQSDETDEVNARVHHVSANEQAIIDQAETKLSKFFHKDKGILSGGSSLREVDCVDADNGNEMHRINKLMVKARWGKAKMSRPSNMSKRDWNRRKYDGATTVAKLAAQHPKRFAELFEMRVDKTTNKVKHGNTEQRHLAYGVLYALAAEGHSIERLEHIKANIVRRMDDVAGNRRDGAMFEFELRNTIKAMNKGTSGDRAVGANLGMAVDQKHQFWTHANFEAQEEAYAYTEGTAEAAQAAGGNHPDHLHALQTFGLTEHDAGYVLAHITARLPALESSATDHAFDAEGGRFANQDELRDAREIQREDAHNNAQNEQQDGVDKSRHVLRPGDNGYVETFNQKMAAILKVSEYGAASDRNDVARLYEKSDHIQEERLDKVRAIIYLLGMANPEKVMSDELGPLAVEISSLDLEQLDLLLARQNVAPGNGPDTSWSETTLAVQEVFRPENHERELQRRKNDRFQRRQQQNVEQNLNMGGLADIEPAKKKKYDADSAAFEIERRRAKIEFLKQREAVIEPNDLVEPNDDDLVDDDDGKNKVIGIDPEDVAPVVGLLGVLLNPND